MGYLIDTCIWVEVERGRLSPRDVASFTGKEPVFISPVTIAELSFGAEVAKDDHIRQKRWSALNRLRKKPVLLIDESTGDIFGKIAASLQRSGRGHDFRVQDLWLASQSIQHGIRLLTMNEKDFLDVPGLDLVVIKKQKRPP